MAVPPEVIEVVGVVEVTEEIEIVNGTYYTNVNYGEYVIPDYKSVEEEKKALEAQMFNAQALLHFGMQNIDTVEELRELMKIAITKLNKP